MTKVLSTLGFVAALALFANEGAKADAHHHHHCFEKALANIPADKKEAAKDQFEKCHKALAAHDHEGARHCAHEVLEHVKVDAKEAMEVVKDYVACVKAHHAEPHEANK